MQPDQDSADTRRYSLKLGSGRRITLKSISQRMTYAGLLGGHPTHQLNEELISELVEEVKQDSWYAGSVHVVPPRRQDYLREPGDMSRMSNYGPPVEWIPMISCVGRFESLPPARDQTMDASSLSIIWFQDAFAMPIATTIMDAICSLDWTSLATDFAY